MGVMVLNNYPDVLYQTCCNKCGSTSIEKLNDIDGKCNKCGHVEIYNEMYKTELEDNIECPKCKINTRLYTYDLFYGVQVDCPKCNEVYEIIVE